MRVSGEKPYAIHFWKGGSNNEEVYVIGTIVVMRL